MKYFKLTELSIFLLMLCCYPVMSDIPVHCVKSQIVGEWMIHATKPTIQNDLYKFTCGHKLPSRENHSYLIKPNSDYGIKFKVRLQEDDQAILFLNKSKKEGKWTMVYNEGFDILAGKRSFFAFSKYAKNNNKNSNIDTRWVSKCYSTLIGWYHIGPKKWGCFYATKIGQNPDEVTNGEPKGKLLVVANTVKTIDLTKKNRFKSLQKKKQQRSIFSNLNTGDEANVVIDNLDSQITNFIQTKEKTLSKEFKDHHKFVDRVKNLTNLWEAGYYDEFSKMTLEELNNFAGRRKIANIDVKKDLDLKKFFENQYPTYNKKIKSAELFKFRSVSKNSQRDKKYPQFPKNHVIDKKYMFPARNQGRCGSCYVMATLSMLEARLRKKTNNKIKEKLSVQHVLSCSVYNQGCQGGYAYLVLKFGKEIELLPEKCMKYKEMNTKCSARCDKKKLKRTYHVKDYKYLGGSYGKCSELEIMKEVMHNGPIVVSFEPDYLFMHYKKGIYKSVGHTWLTRNEPKPQWVKVDHSVVLVGWGYDEEKNVPYWVLQNSWGKNWGEGGYFRMIRGIDHMGIESICEVGTPYFKNISKE